MYGPLIFMEYYNDIVVSLNFKIKTSLTKVEEKMVLILKDESWIRYKNI